MIIEVNDIRRYRQLAENIDPRRVEPYIREAEVLDVAPELGGDEVLRLAAEDRELTDDERTLLSGGSWTDGCGRTHIFEGLKAAVAYLAYSRFVAANAVQVTPYGVVTKEADDSSPASAQSVAAVASTAMKIGRQHLADAVEWWRRKNGQCGCGRHRAGKRHFVAIGD